MNGMPSASAVSWSSSNTAGSSVDPRWITGPEPKRCLPSSFSRVRLVGGERHVDDDREVGLERVRRRPRAGERDLLLRTATAATSAGRAAGLRHQPRRLVGDVAAEAVVERARDQPPVRELDRLAGDHRDVADAHQRARVVAVLRADVDVQVLELGAFLRSSSSSRWIGFLPTTPGTAPSRVSTSSRWPTSTTASQPPTAGEPQEAVVVDVVDDQPDLVDVADDRQQRPVARAATRATLAPPVSCDPSADRPPPPPNPAARPPPLPRRPPPLCARPAAPPRPPPSPPPPPHGHRRAGNTRSPPGCRCAPAR